MRARAVLVQLIKVAAESTTVGIPGTPNPGKLWGAYQKSSLLDSYALEPSNSTPGVRVPRFLEYPRGMQGFTTNISQTRRLPEMVGQPANPGDQWAAQHLPGVAPTELTNVKPDDQSAVYQGGTSGPGQFRIPVVSRRANLLHEATHAGQDSLDMAARWGANPASLETAAMASEVAEGMRQGWSEDRLRAMNSNNAEVPGWVYQKIRQYGPKFDGTPADLQRAQNFGRETRFGTSPLGTKYRDFVRMNGWDPTPAETPPPRPLPVTLKRP